MTTTEYAHVEIEPDGMPMIAGTTIKVVEVALDRLAYHWDAEEIQRQHPHLTLGQIHSALAYYYDHQDEMDRMIAERSERAQRILSDLGPSPLRAKLQAIKYARSRP